MRSPLFVALCVVAGVLFGGGGYWLYGTWPATGTTSASASGAGTYATGKRPRPGKTPAKIIYSSASYHDGIMKVAPSVVSIFARSTSTDASRPSSGSAVRNLDADGDNPRRATSQGSGVIIDADGLVLTNVHVVAGADEIVVVQSNGDRHEALLVGSDRETDLAVLRITATDLPAVSLEPMQRLRVGDIVLAIGNPFGVGQTVTQGIVSATGRQVAGGTAWQNFVQIDAAINPGNSGGALINPSGQLVGLNSAVLAGGSDAEGIGFAIPAELLLQIVPQLIRDGRVRRGWLGIGVDDLAMFPALGKRLTSGAVVTSLVPDGPADRDGLQRHDVILAIDDQPVSSAIGLMLLVSSLSPDSRSSLQVQRGDEQLELTVVLGERGDPSSTLQLR